MEPGSGTKQVFLISGNDAHLKSRLRNVGELPVSSEVIIVYTDKLPPGPGEFIRGLACTHDNITIDVIRNAKKGAIVKRMVRLIREIHTKRPDVRINLLGGRYASSVLSEMEKSSFFSYSESLPEPLSREQFATTEPEEGEIYDAGGKMYILIDYENVGTAGLTGCEYLSADDYIVLFYSESSRQIEKQYITAMEEHAGGFEIVKLVNVAKNGLDFYIAVKAGQIAESSPETKVVIVSNDKGFYSVRDYCNRYTGLQNRIIIKSSIEAEQIISMIHETRTPRERYLAALRTFGRSDGSKIYRLIKKAV